MRYIFFFGIIFLIELYSFLGGVQSLTGKSLLIYKVAHLFGVLILLFQIYIVTYYIPSQGGTGNTYTTLVSGLMMAFVVAKFILLFFFLGEDIYRLFRLVFDFITVKKDKIALEDRREFITKVGLSLAALPFGALIYGVLKGRYDFKVHKVVLKFKDLPESFNGFKIAQISDVHSGSFDGTDIVEKGLNLLQEQNPDIILFTGDLVNNYAHEIEPYLSLFRKLEAPYGKFSVLGNHDYGLYGRWNNELEISQNMAELEKHHEQMGFQLLNNQNVLVRRNEGTIRLVGVENWGNLPFPQKGDLDQALVNVVPTEFTVLMSHDPDHWEAKTLPNPKNINLTLAGHTHGMQFGIEIPGFKWSPVKYKYPRWAGLYKENGQYLYVNRGFGYIGYPGRFGIWPEVTIIELQKA